MVKELYSSNNQLHGSVFSCFDGEKDFGTWYWLTRIYVTCFERLMTAFHRYLQTPSELEGILHHSSIPPSELLLHEPSLSGYRSLHPQRSIFGGAVWGLVQTDRSAMM